MSRLQEAKARLETALGRLESVLTKPGAPRSVAERVGRIGELERELERLNREHMALEATVDQVTARLDSVIRRLRENAE
jgi:hypothetical protein